ncbi:endonuclease domain-containing 1 protein-like isoform X2 [Carcharodon carcharias]|uniref:endonuclease domain-containing 1 protein-like isoform X2 n=1 Tax=Carcharodon carcharias TaxID=13397 RepID=UPI001B7E278D|nr:endonuclease domain-containing 1 protein-like isoform X2 [Carcharodon carcharias]
MGTASLALFLLLPVLDPGAVQGEVIQDLNNCSWFFQGKTPPQGFDTQNRIKICQRYKNHYHFVTLYRTDLRIPVYSAYRYPCTMGVDKKRRPSPWFYEPQIDDPRASMEMISSNGTSSGNQAVDTDYQRSGYDRGHLYPFSFNSNDSATATTTLTNAVPQKHKANENWAEEAESIVRKLAVECHRSGRSMYVVTGSANSTNIKLKNKIVVPEVAWTALCCTSPPDQNNDPCLNNNLQSERENVMMYNKDFSAAFRKRMMPEETTVRLTVRELQEQLGVVKMFESCRGTSADDEAETFKEPLAF